MNFKKIRVLIHDLKYWFLGWHNKFSRIKIPLQKLGDDWVCVSNFSTKIKSRAGFDDINENRIYNMELSCSHIDRIVLAPDTIFSMQEIIGEPTENSGFRSGPTIIEGRIHSTCGGGLCQISSTIFNAALLANLEILEKHNHSVDTWGDERFIPLGRDATYAYALKDLKFRNPFKHKIVVRLKVDKNRKIVSSSIWAMKKLPYRVQVECNIVKELEPRIKSTDSKKIIKGWHVRTTRYIRDSNNQTQTTYQCQAFYKPVVF